MSMKTFFYGFSPFTGLSTFMAVLGVAIAVSGDSKLMVWLGMEINVFGFVGVMKSRYLYEGSLMKYFLAQAVGSSFILWSIILGLSFGSSWVSFISDSMMQMGIFFKLGMFPFHMWFPSVMAHSDWVILVWLMTVQKVGPLMLVSFLSSHSILMCFSIVITSFIGSIGGIDKTSISSIMAYSSLLNMGWICFVSVSLKSLFVWFILSYFFQVILSLMFFYLIGLDKLKNDESSLGAAVSVLGISSIPPFPLFMLKMMVITSSMDVVVVVFLIFSSLISLTYYLRAGVFFMMKSMTMLESRVQGFIISYFIFWLICYLVLMVYVFG